MVDKYSNKTMKTVISKPGQLLKLLALAVLAVVLLNGAKSILFPCPSFKIVRSSDKSALPRPLSISPDSSDSVKTWYTLLTIEERGLTGYGAEVVAEEEAKEEKLAVKRDKAAVNQGKEAKPDSVKYTCSDQLLGKPGTVFAAKCGHECDLLTCKNLLADRTAGSEFTKKLLEQVKWFKKEYKTKLRNDHSLSKLACDVLKKRFGYNRDVTTKEELEFPLAFNLIVHKDSDQVNRLLSVIYRPHNSYCIHVDRKSSDNMKSAIVQLSRCLKNVFVASTLETVTYAGFSRLKADINCMKDQVKRKTKWRYLINMAGQAFPLKTNLELVQILKTYNGHNDIEGLYGRNIKSRYENEYKEVPGKYKPVKTGNKNPPVPHNIEILRGSAYGTFSKPFVKWLLTDKAAIALLEWSRNTYSPDEHYWATLGHAYVNPHLHAPGAYQGIPNEKEWVSVYASWAPKGPCHGTWRHGTCVFASEDILYLTTQRKELFANKFQADKYPIAFDCLEAWIRWKEQCRPSHDLTYYKSMKISSLL